MEIIWQFGGEQVPHSALSPDLASSYFNLFAPHRLKQFLRATKFWSSDEVNSVLSK